MTTTKKQEGNTCSFRKAPTKPVWWAAYLLEMVAAKVVRKMEGTLGGEVDVDCILQGILRFCEPIMNPSVFWGFGEEKALGTTG